MCLVATFALVCACSGTASANTTYTMPTNSSFKAFMAYTTITNRSSKQWQLQQEAETDENGLRTYNNRYMVAVGTFFDASVGTYIDVELSTGVVLPCVIGDIKQNIHTDSLNLQAPNGNIVEFIIDEHVLPSYVKSAGDISKLPGFEGYVSRVTILDSGDVNSDTIISQVESVTQITTPTKDITQLTYATSTDLNNMYVEEEVFTTSMPETEVFVTYSDDEITVY